MGAFSDFYVTQIEDDLNWREKELSILRRHLYQTTVGDVQDKALLRANLAMIYAHYEGFCKFAITVYIDALNKRKLKRGQLRWPIAVHSMKKFFNSLKAESRRDLFFSRFLLEFDSQLEEIAECENIAETSNLWPNLLEEWLVRLGLSTTNVQAQNNYLHSLVNARNKIAHGRELYVADRTTLDTYAEAARLAMHEVAVEIADALEKQGYQQFSQVYSIVGHAP